MGSLTPSFPCSCSLNIAFAMAAVAEPVLGAEEAPVQVAEMDVDVEEAPEAEPISNVGPVGGPGGAPDHQVITAEAAQKVAQVAPAGKLDSALTRLFNENEVLKPHLGDFYMFES